MATVLEMPYWEKVKRNVMSSKILDTCIHLKWSSLQKEDVEPLVLLVYLFLDPLSCKGKSLVHATDAEAKLEFQMHVNA